MRSILATASALALCTLLVAAPARAIDAFEIQVYDGTADAPGVPSLELHANRIMSGLGTAEPPLAPPDHQSHFTLESALGVAPFCELGAYLQSALLADGEFEYAGFKLRSKFVSPPGWHPHLRIGVNVELAFVPDRFETAARARSCARSSPGKTRTGCSLSTRSSRSRWRSPSGTRGRRSRRR